MPRRKQGHSKESATGDHLKKKTDTGILVQNESFKHFPTSNDLVFKIKKTVSSNFPLPTRNEKIERDYIEVSKSLNDIIMVSQHEVNNNLVKPVQVQDENKIDKGEVLSFCDLGDNVEEICEKNTSQNSVISSSVMNMSVNNPFSTVSTSIEEQNQRLFMAQEVSETLQKSVIQSIKNRTFKRNGSRVSTSISQPSTKNVNSLDSIDRNSPPENEKQNAEMSGVTPCLNAKEGSGNKTDSQQMNYRISTSENRSSHLKDDVNPILQQNCQLPSSVYGTPASSIEKVLTGIQICEKDDAGMKSSAAGKISFLQEILEKKSIKSTTNDLAADFRENKGASEHSKLLAGEDALIPNAKNLSNCDEDKEVIRTESASQFKLRLHITDALNNDDSSSSILSTESQRTLKCPKITSPKVLEQHISKIISENAAIVETLDPMWSRRYFKQTSQTSLSNNEGDSKKISGKLSRVIEEKSFTSSFDSSSGKSKLHSALLGGSEVESLNSAQNIPSTVASTKERNFAQFGNLLTTVPSASMYSKIVCSASEEELKGSAIKSLLSLKQGHYSKHKKSFCFNKDSYNQHPQNPEGSIIKDLLLKNKSPDEFKSDDNEDKNFPYTSSNVVNDFNNPSDKHTSLFKCSQCLAEFPDKCKLDIHLSYCDPTSQMPSLRDITEKFQLKETSSQSKPLEGMDFSYQTRDRSWEESLQNVSTSENDSEVVGQILKKQLLMPRSPPMKKRKVSDSFFAGSYFMEQSLDNVANKYGGNSFPTKSFTNIEIPPHRSRSQSVHLFGGEVQVLDGSNAKKIKIKTTLPSAFSMFSNKFSNSIKKSKVSDDLEIDKETTSLSGVIVNIAQPVHNSGGTVHLSNRKSASNMSPSVASSNISDRISTYTKVDASSIPNFSRIGHQSNDRKEFDQNLLSYPYDIFPGPHSKGFPLHNYGTSSLMKNGVIPGPTVDEISPGTVKVTLSPSSKPFYSPIFSTIDKSFELPLTTNLNEGTNHSVIPTVLFTPSSPTMPSSENETSFPTETSISEPTKKFLTPTRPTSLPLKKKPFTMVSSTLVSPETPRPKKSCVQLYLNGHAYTYLGLKCSTRSTYCSIYRPQPMFVPQETNPKLSMYSNWQVMPAKEELSGLTPGQMISFYCSKQRKESKTITVNAKLGEPLIFTHSSYWTYRSQDHPEKAETSKSFSDSNQDHVKDSQPMESAQELIQGENSRSESVISSFGNIPEKLVHSTDDSSLHVDTENTLSDDLNNSNDEDDDDEDCQDDGTESLTDSSQPQPPKRVKIFEGGFKSNEDYTYVRGRGRGKYVCEECGIRCKKPSMLKKHIRTHTDLRPYKCRHCSFAFKTKGNLTKHMKSKAHHKKCTELGITPVPTTTDDSQIDEEALAKQIEKKKTQFSDGEDADDDDDEDSDESDDECESDTSSMITSNQNSRMLPNGHSRKYDSQEKLDIDSLDETTGGKEPMSQQTLEQEAVRSLLNLSALGEPSQWSTSTGDLTDVTSPAESEVSSLTMRSEQSLLSPSQFSHNVPTIQFSSRSKNVSDQWLTTETLGHRPRSYSADIPQSSGKDSLTKFKISRNLNSDDTLTTPVDEFSEFGGREQYARRYSISVAREARKPRVLNAPDWVRLNSSSLNSQKWPEGETSDQPMDLSVTRDLSKCKSMYAASVSSSLMNIVTQEENGPDSSLNTNLDTFGESYQLKSLPVLSPQVLVEYEAGCENSSDASLLPLAAEPVSFGSNTPTRNLYYVQDVPLSDSASTRKDTDTTDDPPSPDIADYAVCSPVSPPALEDSAYYYPQENMTQSSTNPEEGPPSSRFRAEFIVPSSSSSGMEEGKCICRICNKIFAKSSHLRLHVNIHYFERPFRCDNCAVSFRTKGHLQKHKRSVSHYNKVNMNLTFGTPTVDNPRPFKCADCKIAFRIHGHLAKHLRSKMHIMKLECLGKLPFGMYAEMERSGMSLNEIDTTDCNNSLESLQVMAQKLYQRDPRRMRWQGAEQTSDTGCVLPPAAVATTLMDSMLPISEPMATGYDAVCAPIALAGSVHSPEEVKQELSEAEALRMASVFADSDSPISPMSRYIISQPSITTSQETVQRAEVPESDSAVSLHRSGTCHICGRLFKSAKFLQVHLYSDHPTWNSPSVTEVTSSDSPVSCVSNVVELPCEICGKQFPNQKTLQQHLLTHAQPRPFVCELCDAGFTSSSSLVAHKATHQNSSSMSSENRPVQLK